MHRDSTCSSAACSVWSPDGQPGFYADGPFVGDAFTHHGSTWRLVGTAYPVGRLPICSHLVEAYRLYVGDDELEGLYVKVARRFHESRAWLEEHQPGLASPHSLTPPCVHQAQPRPNAPSRRPIPTG